MTNQNTVKSASSSTSNPDEKYMSRATITRSRWTKEKRAAANLHRKQQRAIKRQQLKDAGIEVGGNKKEIFTEEQFAKMKEEWKRINRPYVEAQKEALRRKRKANGLHSNLFTQVY